VVPRARVRQAWTKTPLDIDSLMRPQSPDAHPATGPHHLPNVFGNALDLYCTCRGSDVSPEAEDTLQLHRQRRVRSRNCRNRPRRRGPRWLAIWRGEKVRHAFRRHFFLLIGLLTLSLFFLVEGLDRAGKPETAHVLAGPMRVLIVPMYLVWLVITMAYVAIVGPVGVPGPFAAVVWGITMVAGLAPYALADYVLNKCASIFRKHRPPEIR